MRCAVGQVEGTEEMLSSKERQVWVIWERLEEQLEERESREVEEDGKEEGCCCSCQPLE